MRAISLLIQASGVSRNQRRTVSPVGSSLCTAEHLQLQFISHLQLQQGAQALWQPDRQNIAPAADPLRRFRDRLMLMREIELSSAFPDLQAHIHSRETGATLASGPMADQIGAERGRPPEQWGSSLGFVLAAAGSAVGLGNLWGFAYRASQGGGAAFVLLYVVIVAVVCLPVLVAEMVLGRSTGHAPLVAPITAGGRRWAPLGWLYIAASVGILSYYAVLMGWTGRSLLHALASPLPADMAAAESFFGAISSGGDAVLGHLLSLALTGLVVSAGIRSGIERLSRWGMPLLFLMLLALLVWAAFLPGATSGYAEFLLRWDASKLTDLTTIRNAFTQAFFSIGAGIGCILAYAAYLDRRSGIPGEAVAVVGMDTAVGLMAGCVTFPIVASFALGDVVSSSTVGTLFIALPTGLGSLGMAGRVVAVCFFGLAYVAAITSSVSLLEVPVSSLMDRLGCSRRRAVWLMVLVIAVIGLPSALDVGVLERMDAVFGGVCLIAGGLLMALLMGWRAPERFVADLRESGTAPHLLRWMLWGLRWVSVPVISLGLVVSLVDLAKNWAGGA